MKTLTLSAIILLFYVNIYGQYYYTPNTYYVVPPTSGCNGIWAVNDSIITSGICAPAYLLTINPLGCASFNHQNGDSLFLNLCSIPCSYSMTSFSSSVPCFNCTISLSTQPVTSSCTTSDSIVSIYKDDADRLALRKVFIENSTYIDSINIPATLSDTILDALIAVYNATMIPATDTVTTIYDIHTFPSPTIKDISVAADSNLSWMNQLHNNVIPTGNPSVDSLISNYHLHLSDYYPWNFVPYHIAAFQSDSNYNISALANRFETIPGVIFSEPNNVAGDGNDITDSIYSNFVELVYSLGWGDCPSGCTARRYWKFHVFYDCSVAYLGSYGTPLPLNSVSEIYNDQIKIYPNPNNGMFTISSNGRINSIMVQNVLGEVVYKSIITTLNSVQFDKTEIDLSSQPKGIYFVTVNNGNIIHSKKVIKL